MTVEHVWQPHPSMPYQLLQGYTNALVRTKPTPDGFYIWQFRKVVGYADSVDSAKHAVEAAAEFFDVMKRNPYL